MIMSKLEKGKIEFDDPNFKPNDEKKWIDYPDDFLKDMIQVNPNAEPDEFESMDLMEQMKHTFGYKVGESSIKSQIEAELKGLREAMQKEIEQIESELEGDSDYKSTYAERIEGELMGLNTAIELIDKHAKNIEKLFE